MAWSDRARLFPLTWHRAVRCWRWVGAAPSQLIKQVAPDVLFANEDEAAVVADARDRKAPPGGGILQPCADRRDQAGRGRLPARLAFGGRPCLEFGGRHSTACGGRYDGRRRCVRRRVSFRFVGGRVSSEHESEREGGRGALAPGGARGTPGCGSTSHVAAQGAATLMSAPVTVSTRIRAALDAGRAVVALESTLITHGLAAPQKS